MTDVAGSEFKETTQALLMAAQYLDERTILEKLPFITTDEVDGILEKRGLEEMARARADDGSLGEDE